jgi:hypothetical protein
LCSAGYPRPRHRYRFLVVVVASSFDAKMKKRQIAFALPTPPPPSAAAARISVGAAFPFLLFLQAGTTASAKGGAQTTSAFSSALARVQTMTAMSFSMISVLWHWWRL